MKGIKDNETGRFVKNIEDRKCLICGELFQPRHDKQKACSWICRSGLISLHFNKQEERTCKYCGELFKVSPSSKSLYCKKECYSKDMVGKNMGESNNFWQGGKSLEPYTIDWKETLKRSIRERDHYTCQMPGCNKQQGDRSLDVHHIDYNKKNCDPSNLISLCHSCHAKTNTNRNYWLELFKNICR